MCCSTGICGPVLDPVLVKMNDALMELKKQGVVVKMNFSKTDGRYRYGI